MGISPLEHGPRRLDPVGVHVAPDVFPSGVIDRVARVAGNPVIGRVVVGVEGVSAQSACQPIDYRSLMEHGVQTSPTRLPPSLKDRRMSGMVPGPAHNGAGGDLQALERLHGRQATRNPRLPSPVNQECVSWLPRYVDERISASRTRRT